MQESSPGSHFNGSERSEPQTRRAPEVVDSLRSGAKPTASPEAGGFFAAGGFRVQANGRGAEPACGPALHGSVWSRASPLRREVQLLEPAVSFLLFVANWALDVASEPFRKPVPGSILI